MPKVIELTVQLEVQKVSCPGVWLCQDGRVSLTVFTLGTSYQTCMLPPMFPLVYNDVFYFRKRFQDTCALSNVCCLLKDEAIYCELVQWSEDCVGDECTILAQYLGSLNDVLFPSNMCSSEGVDLLMRRSKEYPGILSPKIEISTKVRIDELLEQPTAPVNKPLKIKACTCVKKDVDQKRQKQVCHTPLYHRIKCNKRPRSRPCSRSRSRSNSRSYCSLTAGEPDCMPSLACDCPSISKSHMSIRDNIPACREFAVYNMRMPAMDNIWRGAVNNTYTSSDSECDYDQRKNSEDENGGSNHQEKRIKFTLESQFIEQHVGDDAKGSRLRRSHMTRIMPCTCEICKRYYEFFHMDAYKS